MILKSIKLNNIRSYLNQEIKFPTGSVLLSGDIGSGKSSILLAVEFALFGVRRKHLPAFSLLRHGKKEGAVELRFELEGKDIIVKRVLKRGKDDISQEAGYVIINGTKKEGTAIELKTLVFDLLGYPKNLVTKSKDLVYRFTVYMPQEEMKQILLEDKDTRLDTLRKVFNIDKYKRIRENSLIFIRGLKEKRKENEGKIADLEEKKKQKKERQKNIGEIDEKINGLMPKLDKIKKELKNKKNEIEKIEKNINELGKLKKELEINELNLKNKLEQRKNNKENIEKLEKQINILNEELEKSEKIKGEELVRRITEKENEIKLMDKTIKEINNKINEFTIKKNFSYNIKQKISKLEKCPTCEQDVSKEHKQSVIEREDNLIKSLEENISLHTQQHSEAEKKILELKNILRDLKKKENEVSVVKIKLENLNEKNKEKNNLLNLQEKIKKEIGIINTKKIELNKKTEEFKNIEEDYKKIKVSLEKIVQEEKELQIEKAGLEKEKQTLKKLMEFLDKEIKEKLKIKENLVYLSQLQNWLEKYFINLMNTIEKHVMLSVHREFNELFQRWFNILIEDEAISVRLNDEFTPVIEQNGYETFLGNLSGGERTSIALSYRLALNKVINDIIGEVKTKDILMLDEPTDGFSSEQLDKIREVLDQLNIKQIILVSHEPKIESFVDNVVRINKEEHISSVV